MAAYTCKRCGYSTDVKHALIRHWKRKILCAPTLEDLPVDIMIQELLSTNANVTFSCSFCQRRFNNKSNMYKHAKICKKKPNELELIKQEIQTLKSKLETSASHITNNTQNVHVIQNFNIHLKEFGFENVSHLSKDFLNYCFANKKLVELIDNIHFYKECPENHNVRLKSKKQELMEVFENGNWVVKDQDQTLTELIEKGYRILYRHGKQNKDTIMEEEEIDDDEFQEIHRWLERIYEDQNSQKPLKRDLIIRFINNQAILLGR